jgi:hypothetical protein
MMISLNECGMTSRIYCQMKKATDKRIPSLCYPSCENKEDIRKYSSVCPVCAKRNPGRICQIIIILNSNKRDRNWIERREEWK